LRTLGRAFELVGAKLEAAPAALSGVNYQLLFRVLQTLHQMIERIADVLGRFAHGVGDLRKGHGLVEQQRNEVAAIHSNVNLPALGRPSIGACHNDSFEHRRAMVALSFDESSFLPRQRFA